MDKSPLQKQIEQWKAEAETAHDELVSHGISNNWNSLAYYDGIIEAYTAVLRALAVENDAALERERHPLYIIDPRNGWELRPPRSIEEQATVLERAWIKDRRARLIAKRVVPEAEGCTCDDPDCCYQELDPPPTQEELDKAR